MPQNCAFSTRGLVTGFRSRVVLKGLSFEIPWGRTTVLLGPGGSGKSTLLRVFNGDLKPGEGFWQEGRFESRADDTTRLPQGTHHLPTKGCTLGEGLEEVTGESADTALKATWSTAPDAVESLLPLLSMPMDETKLPTRRLAEFTLAAATNDSVLLLDEPQMGLPPQAASRVFEKLTDLGRTRTQVIVTHNLRLAEAVAHVVMLLVDGEVVEIADKEAFFDRPMQTRTREFLRWGA